MSTDWTIASTVAIVCVEFNGEEGLVCTWSSCERGYQGQDENGLISLLQICDALTMNKSVSTRAQISVWDGRGCRVIRNDVCSRVCAVLCLVSGPMNRLNDDNVPPTCVQHHNTALHAAARENHFGIVAFLLENKASVNLQNKVICVCGDVWSNLRDCLFRSSEVMLRVSIECAIGNRV